VTQRAPSAKSGPAPRTRRHPPPPPPRAASSSAARGCGGEPWPGADGGGAVRVASAWLAGGGARGVGGMTSGERQAGQGSRAMAWRESRPCGVRRARAWRESGRQACGSDGARGPRNGGPPAERRGSGGRSGVDQGKRALRAVGQADRAASPRAGVRVLARAPRCVPCGSGQRTAPKAKSRPHSQQRVRASSSADRGAVGGWYESSAGAGMAAGARTDLGGASWCVRSASGRASGRIDGGSSAARSAVIDRLKKVS
jgi:hypothetical protein